nr:TonB-dependent receptor [uncultured Draconibacterium sp.]
MKNRINLSSQKALSALMKNYLIKTLVVVLGIFINLSLFAQDTKTITGTVVDEQDNPVIGATVIVKGTQIGVPTDIDGNFELQVPTDKEILLISFIGMEPQEINIANQTKLEVVLAPSSVQLEETIVVGYGQQKKESVVGAITQTKGETLERTGGVTSIGAALTGNLPGVITVTSSGSPGGDDPTIYIRGQSTWNESSPLILVDGIERSMNSVDISSIESISVLKDASATAVFGVKGANGVILITTKRGQLGRAEIRISASATMKRPSKIPGKLDSYDALLLRNQVIERELGLYGNSWEDYTPQTILDKYRYPANEEERQRYVNVDWADALVRDYVMSYKANISASGGTKSVKYFTSLDFVSEGDILKHYENSKGYSPGYGYNRLNARSNLDFDLTNTTVFSVNLAGSYAIKQDVYGQDDWEYRIWEAIYTSAPDSYLPLYPDGSWGYYEPDELEAYNSAATLANNGIRRKATTTITTDFSLKQDLGMVLDGLTAKGTLSFDNRFYTVGGVYDNGNVQTTWVDPATGEVIHGRYLGTNQFDWIPTKWSTRADESYTNIYGGSDDYRKLYYQLQLNYAKKFGKHDVTGMGLFSRDKFATGSEFEHYREDWVFRATYNYASKYFAEFNGAYNGSEKFGPGYRFDFFPSGALGWMISEENFMKRFSFLDMLKLRASYGEVGSDNDWRRFLYLSQWSYGGSSKLGSGPNDESPYTWWKESSIGNPDIHWEKVAKTNFGADFAVFNGLVSGSVDVFEDHRTDVLLAGDSRAVPSYFGGTPATGNLGEVDVKGYELDIRVNKVLDNGLRLWGNFSLSHAKDKVIKADDQELLDDYQKKAGKQIGQTYSQITDGFFNTWDEVYASTKFVSWDSDKLPGNQYIVDYNGDGVIDNFDNVPYGYPERPQNTYSCSVGTEWKGFSVYLQFYGVNNTNRRVDFNNFNNRTNKAYDLGTYWTPENANSADLPMPRWNSHMDYSGDNTLYDGSYVRLKNAEIAYTFNKTAVARFGLSELRIFLNGNNLWMWTNMPDDREVNNNHNSAYPTMKRINLGFNITL